MFTRSLLVGISTLAMATGGASAQPNVNTISSIGIGNTAACNNAAPASTGNACTITQTGTNNRSVIGQTGNGNIAAHNQIAGANSNSQTSQTGNTNIVAHNQYGGTNNNAETNQNGDSNNTQLVQNGGFNDSLTSQSGVGHTATIRQLGGTTTGTGNFARVTQGDSPLMADNGAVSLQQRGTSNSATISQAGALGSAFVTQGGTIDASGAGTGTQSGSSNVVSVTTAGIGEFANINQRGTGGAGQDVVNGNHATVSMNNNALAAAFFFQNLGSITQTSSGNRATAIVNDGGASAAPAFPQSQNIVAITQQNPLEDSTIVSNDFAFASVSRGAQLTSQINQSGRNNFADVTLTSGVAGSDPGVPARDGGNFSAINQLGTVAGAGGSTAYVTAQAPFGGTAQGFGNDSDITQTTAIAFLAPTGVQQPAGTTGIGEPANINGSRGLYATLWQQGRYSNAVINQNDGPGQTLANSTYDTGASTVYGRARAGVYQAGVLNTTTVTQSGDNYADVTQGLLGAGSRSVVSLTQTDAGDGTVQSGNDNFGNPIFVPVRAYNRSLVTQYGDRNNIDGFQNTVGGFHSLFQRAGSSDNNVDARQGTGASGNAAFTGASGSRATPGSPFLSGTPPVAAATNGLSATIEQGGTRNYARAYQDGTNLNATVTQLGSGGGAGALQNSVLVLQQGTNNSATAIQSSNVGRSTAAGPAAGPGGRYSHGGGELSAEIVILQGTQVTGPGTGNRAYAEQRGKGQYARIEQTGTNNVAGILQDTGATNAVAAISQEGSNNSYYVVQTAAGQYIDVTQIGSNNTTVTQTGGTGTGSSNGFTPPPGFPSF